MIARRPAPSPVVVSVSVPTAPPICRLVAVALLALGLVATAAAAGGAADPQPAPLTSLSVPQGTRVAGHLGEARTSDDQYIVVDAARQRSKYVTEMLVSAVCPHPNPARLDLTVETGIATGQEVRFEVHLFNHGNGNWTRVGAFRAAGDTVRVFAEIRRPHRFVDASSGVVWARVTSAMPRNRARNGYRVHVDQGEIAVAP
ncbi:MAG: hypothetical protein ACYTG1_08870 [Planctomycetota bacterium]|jgi:hypothetical protein